MILNVKINENQISKYTEKAALIKLPKSDRSFWVSKKFLRPKGKGWALGLIDSWDYKVGAFEMTGEALFEKFGGDLELETDSYLLVESKKVSVEEFKAAEKSEVEEKW